MKPILEIKDVLNTYKSQYHGIKAIEKYQSWFPLKPSPKLAGVIGDLMGDGHLQGGPKWRVDYTSKYEKELKRFDKEVFILFGVKGKIRKCTTNNYNTKNLGINNKPLARTLKLIGTPAGAKVFIKFNIPYWILKDKENFRRFISRLFSCEACVDMNSKCIEIKMHKIKILLMMESSFLIQLKNTYTNILV